VNQVALRFFSRSRFSQTVDASFDFESTGWPWQPPSLALC
jgi:hypothetical protein